LLQHRFICYFRIHIALLWDFANIRLPRKINGLHAPSGEYFEFYSPSDTD
jgi:hypothetical protein